MPADLLFVYGSLITAIGHPMGERLRREAALVGPGRVQGRMYRVSWYPGVVLSDAAEDGVEGELYRLRTPAATLVWLDAYESITPGVAGQPSGVAGNDEYERRRVTVQCKAAGACDAWIYLYRRAPDDLERITSGRWQG